MNYAIQQILEEILGQPQSVNESTGQFRFDCPICAMNNPSIKEGETDGKGNLEVNIETINDSGGKGMYNCWACGGSHGTHGSLSKLISKFGNKSHYKRYLAELSQEDKNFILGRSKNTVIPKKVKNGLREIKLYENFKTFEIKTDKPDYQFRSAINYLRARNITPDLIYKYKLKYCDKYEKIDGLRSFHGRIIFPSFDIDGKVNYFVARDYWNRNKKYKYQNPEVEKDEIIFNEYFINYDQDIYLVEGVTDHIVTPNSIPMLGKNISDLLFRTLQEKAKANVIIFLDDDAFKSIIKLYDKLNVDKLRGRVRFIKIKPIKDTELDPSKINELYGKKGIINYLKIQRKKTIKDKIESFI